MFAELVSWLLFLSLLKGDVECSSPHCDPALSSVAEGVLGQTGAFPWLGVLRVHLHEDGTFKVALTGIVLVKEGFAIANADDVARIPRRVFKEDSKAMFISGDQQPWFCKLKDYMTHPEFEYETMNTIALVELDPGERRYYPMPPVCWPQYSYNASDQLYVAGYTDENKLLEKLTYKLQYVDQTLCKEFYNRAGLTEGKKTPRHYQCGFAQSNTENCVWDNGMALVSNASGYWMLIGLSVHGPGCAAPARFIDLLPYYQWIESATNLQEIDDYRRSAFGEGFKPEKKRVKEEIPVHDLLRTDTAEASAQHRAGGGGGGGGKQAFAHYYRFPAWDSGDMFSIDRINNTEIELTRITDGQHGNCSLRSNRLIYKDYFRVERPAPAPRLPFPVPLPRGSVTYRLSMYNLYYLNYTCVKIKVLSTVPEQAYLYYTMDFNQLESGFPETPQEVIRIYPITASPLFTTTTNIWRPGHHLRPKVQHELPKEYSVRNLNLFIRIEFALEGRIEVKVFGPYMGLTSSTTRPTTTEPAPTSSTLDPYRILGPPTAPPPKDTTGNKLLRDRSSAESAEHVESYLKKDESFFDAVEGTISFASRTRAGSVLLMLIFVLMLSL